MAGPGSGMVAEVRTGARLHFGLLATSAEQGRPGGIGMMIDRHGFVLRARLAEQDSIIADAATAVRVRRFLDRLRTGLEPWPDAAGQRYRIEVDEVIPPHRGFGSGTQLAFAMASATAKLLGFKAVPLKCLDRGTRSLVGGLGFSRGGFVIDAGEGAAAGLSAAIEATAPCQFGGHVLSVPEDWRFVIIDPTTQSGISGVEEESAFAGLNAFPAATSEKLARLITEAIVPGLSRKEFERFAAGVSEFNRLVGEQFAPAQRGVYAHPLIRELSKRLGESDWPYLAQSSWGPAATVFCESEVSAAALCRFLSDCLPADAARIFVAAPRNRGADVTHHAA